MTIEKINDKIAYLDRLFANEEIIPGTPAAKARNSQYDVIYAMIAELEEETGKEYIITECGVVEC